MRTITSFGDRTSGTSLIIASVSPMKITRSHGARFSKLPVITGPVIMFCFSFQMRVSKRLKVAQ